MCTMRTWMMIAPVTLAIAAAGCGETRTQKATTGAAGGALAGAVVGGPVGALVGAGIGGAGGAYREELTPGADKAVSQAFNRAEQEMGGGSGTTGAAIQPSSTSAQASERTADDLTNREVREAQTALKDMGLYEGRIDGIYGRQTIGAVREFQTRQDIRRTGALDDLTQRELQTAAASGGAAGERQAAPSDSGQSQPMQEPAQAQSGQETGSETRGATGAAIEPPERGQAGGVSQADVRKAQTALKEMGLYEGQVDGIHGPRTMDAVRQFQAQNDLERTGTLDRQTLERLQTAASGSGAGQQGQPTGAGQPRGDQSPPAAEPREPGAGEPSGQREPSTR
jgi:peptidoglycan hydrolase-like protein with peptidoglycan-binding domain